MVPSNFANLTWDAPALVVLTSRVVVLPAGLVGVATGIEFVEATGVVGMVVVVVALVLIVCVLVVTSDVDPEFCNLPCLDPPKRMVIMFLDLFWKSIYICRRQHLPTF